MRLLWALVVVLVIVGITGCSSPPSTEKTVQAKPVAKEKEEVIISDTIEVEAGYYRYFKIYTPVNAENIRLKGNFRAYGGSGNDIIVLIMDETNFINWENGHEAYTLYNSGKVTVGEFNVPLLSGKTYYLVLDNSFSVLSNKGVEIKAMMTYIIS